tara:strand:- start:1242 stop:1934 length:693 start_codon:yes stop_codon:yes gene_type:complete
MCGRKTLTKDKKAIIKELFIDEWQDDNYEPSFNIAPTQDSPVLISLGNSRVIKLMRWGLIPSWSKNRSIGSKMINARSETILEKVSYKNLVYTNRCVIISDGYYEWKRYGDVKKPFYIHHPEKKLLLMAGLWTSWRSSSGSVSTYTVITTTPQKEIAHIHDRMPVILDIGEVDNWIRPNKDNKIPTQLDSLKSYIGKLICHPVSNFVNSTGNNSIKCIKPTDETNELSLF